MKPASTQRLKSIDLCRGLTIAFMIFINASALAPSYAWFTHAAWHGCTLADLVFPLFLFIVGFSIGLAKKDIKHILSRAGLIFLWGLLLNLIMSFNFSLDFSHLRILGVLQRIALCYAVTATLYLKTSYRTQLVFCASLLLGYWLILLWIPIPYFGAYTLTPHGNLAGFVDRIFLAGHTYPGAYDAEGLLSTLPAIASTSIGLLCYQLFKQLKQPKKRLYYLSCLGLIFITMGWIWGLYFPINKNLWSSSYVLLTSGIALLFFIFCYGITDVFRPKAKQSVFVFMGQHALMLYVLHLVFIKLQLSITLPGSPKPTSLIHHIINDFTLFLSRENAALLYAVSYTLIWISLTALAYHRFNRTKIKKNH